MKANQLMPAVVSIALVVGICDDTLAGSKRKARSKARQTASEIAQGEQTLAKFLAQHEVVTGTKFNEVMDGVFQRLIQTPEVAARNLPYEIHMVKSDEANAFCTPGGKVVVLSGITSILREDEDLWAALLAHELAHAVRSHTYSQNKKAKGLGFATRFLRTVGNLAPGLSGAGAGAARTAEIADKAGDAATGLNVLSPLLMRKFSRTDEADADAQGMLYMAKAGFDPRGAIRFHEELERRFASNQKALGTFLRTHPRETVRMQRLSELLPVVVKLVEAGAPGQVQVVSNSARTR